MKKLSKITTAIAMASLIIVSSGTSALAAGNGKENANLTEVASSLSSPISSTGIVQPYVIRDPFDDFAGDYTQFHFGSIVPFNAQVLPNSISQLKSAMFKGYLIGTMGDKFLESNTTLGSKLSAGMRNSLLMGLESVFSSLLSSQPQYYVQTFVYRKDLGNGTYDYWTINYAYSDQYGANIMKYTEYHEIV